MEYHFDLKGNAKPITINPEIMVLASLKIQHAESGSDLSFAEWLKSGEKQG